LPRDDALIPQNWVADFGMRNVLFAPVMDSGRSNNSADYSKLRPPPERRPPCA
jgi:hypothetical protein